MTSFLLSSMLLLAAQGAAVPVILDTDLGDDIDDTWALMMLLGSPQVDLKLIVTASDDTEIKTRLVAKLLEKAGRTDIPLGKGLKNSSNPINQAKWLGDYALTAYKGKVIEDGVQALIEAINASPVMVTLLVIGPQTNIREALKRDPGIAKKARFVSMAGSVEIGYNGKKGRDPEWNVVKDVEAAKAVFAAPWEIIMAPLDSCGTLVLKGDRYATVEAAATPRAKVLIENYHDWSNFKHYPKGESSVLFDTVAAYLAFDESFCEMKTVNLVIDDKGNTVPDEKGRPVRCAMGWTNRAAFEDLLVSSLIK
jgi:inosine-uridine nucleoside N-ribohydrolase